MTHPTPAPPTVPELIKERRDQVAADRLRFVEQATRTLAMFDGALSELDHLLVMLDTFPKPGDTDG